MPDGGGAAHLERFERLVGAEGISRLRSRHVMVIGLGGVGGACAEALARSGIGTLTLVDGDAVALTNLNRQVVSTRETLGQEKVAAMRARILSVDPGIKVIPLCRHLTPEAAGELLADAHPDAVVDAVDDLPVKAALAVCPGDHYRIASMGMGYRFDPTAVRIGDLFEVTHDPLARWLRRRLRREGIRRLTVVYSLEPPARAAAGGGERAPASTAFVPNAAGLALASAVVRRCLSAPTCGTHRD